MKQTYPKIRCSKGLFGGVLMIDLGQMLHDVPQLRWLPHRPDEGEKVAFSGPGVFAEADN